MEELLILLIAIQRTAKDIHYFAKGAEFWSDHLLADKVYDGLEGFMDEIQEGYFMGEELATIPQKMLYERACKMMPEGDFAVYPLFTVLDNLLVKGIALTTELSKASDITAADSDLLGRICADLQAKHGLVYRRLK